MGVLHVFFLFLLLAFTQPTENPVPTVAPTEPIPAPTVAPTTAEPTVVTDAPTEPIPVPTVAPIPEPTVAPTVAPTTAEPTVAPIPEPTVAPTVAPTTAEPTVVTDAPTEPIPEPTVAPTVAPTTAVPTESNKPTVAPTAAPTVAPTAPTTATPTSAPTASPTAVPTVAPTTAAPTNKPQPTVAPTAAPTGVPTPPTTPAPTSPSCYNIHTNGGEVYLCDSNSTNVEFADAWGTTQFDFQSSAWIRLSNVTAGSVFILEVSSLIGITAKFYDELGVLNFQTNNYPQFGIDIKKDGNGFFSQLQFPQSQADRLFLYIEAVNKTTKLGKVNFTTVFAANYSFNNTFPSKDQEVPLVSKIGSKSYLYATWVFPQLGYEEGLNYLQVTASCDNQKINVMEVYVNHCGTGVDCTYPILSAENRLSMNFSLTSIPEKPSFTYQLGFPTDVITEKNTKLLVTIRNPTSSQCSVSVDSYVARYQFFAFNSFRTYGYSSDYLLYVNRYQPFRVADTTNVVMNFDLHDTKIPQISMFFSDNGDDRAQNKEVNKPFYIYNATGDNVVSFPSGAAAPHKSFSIYNSGIDKKATISLSFSVKGAFSWGYYAVIALGVGLIALTVAFVFLMRPKNGEYEPLQQLS